MHYFSGLREKNCNKSPGTPHRLQNPKWPPGGPEMADGHSEQLLLNKFFDLSTPSMRKGCDGGKKKTGKKREKKKENTDENSGH